MTCELVDQRELDRRYLAGQLNDDEASAFESHYFACDRCWALVKGGASVRGAYLGAGMTTTARPRWWLKPLALAAGLALTVFGSWQVVGSRDPAAPNAFRGAGDSIAVHAHMSAGRWQATWSSANEAASFQVRLFSGDGRLLMTRDMTDTTVGFSEDSLFELRRGETLYLEVQQLDLLRRPVARSPLLPLPPPGSPR